MRLPHMLLASAMLIATTQARAIECSKAITTVEKAICEDGELTKVDGDLAKTYESLLDNYDNANRKSLIIGQRKWLKLRAMACITKDHPNAGEKLQACLASVYKERQRELNELMAIQGKFNVAGSHSAPSIEHILDKDLLSSAGYEHEMMPYGDYEKKEVRTPKTCRELFTFDAGIWKYGGDTIGMSARMYAFNTCAFAIYSAQNYSPTIKRDSQNADSYPLVDFNDIKQFSLEFTSVNLVGSRDFIMPGKISFSEAASLGEIKISNNMHSAYSACMGQVDGEHTLYVGKNEYVIDCMHHRFAISPMGDYTGQGRQEVIMSVGSYPISGSARVASVLVAYYDPETKSVRPDLVSPESRLCLLAR